MEKIRIKIKGYDPKVVDNSASQIIDTALRSGVKVIGPIIKKFTVNRSPHIDAKSKEQFEMRIHVRLIEILEPNSKTIDSLTHLQIAAGVGIEIK
jgi:small subunit ribosomal protein S10